MTGGGYLACIIVHKLYRCIQYVFFRAKARSGAICVEASYARNIDQLSGVTVGERYKAMLLCRERNQNLIGYYIMRVTCLRGWV